MNMHIDSCKHRIIYSDYEYFCERCGKVFGEEEVAAEELQGNSSVANVLDMKSVGLDPHGKTPLWQYGLGSIEGYKALRDNGDREVISILSNIAEKLELPPHIASEFLYLYRKFCKGKKDKVAAAKLALLLLLLKRKELSLKIMKLLTEIKDKGEGEGGEEEGGEGKEEERGRRGGEEVSDSIHYECYKYMIDIVNQQFNTKKKDSEEDLLRLLPYLQLAPNFAKRYGTAKVGRFLIINQRRR